MSTHPEDQETESLLSNKGKKIISLNSFIITKSWWKQWITSPTFINTYPKIKMYNLFEFAKDEDITFRDFRVSVDDVVRREFLKEFDNVKGLFEFANGNGTLVVPSGSAIPTGEPERDPNRKSSGTNGGMPVQTLFMLLLLHFF